MDIVIQVILAGVFGSCIYMNSIELLDKIVKKREIRSESYKKIENILKVYDHVIKYDRGLAPILEKFDLSELEKHIFNFYGNTQQHLWDTIAILATRDNIIKTQLIQNKVVNEICDTILTPKYFGTEDDKVFNGLLEFIKNAIQTHYRVCVWSDEKE